VVAKHLLWCYNNFAIVSIGLRT